MSTKYHQLKIQKIIRETPDAISIYFQQPENQKIKYKPGQFLTLIVPINGEKVRRSYSMSSCPYTEENLCVTVKRVANGKVSNFLNEHLKEGDVMEVMEPMGSFAVTLHPVQRHVILLGGGSGITPLMSIAKSVLRMEASSIVSLIYANRDEQSIIFKSVIEELRRQYPDRFHVTHVLSQPGPGWSGLSGRLNRSLVIKLIDQLPKLNVHKTDYYLCGPEGMMEELKQALQIMKVPQEKVHYESFVTSSAPSAGAADEQPSGGPHEVTIIYEGSEYKVTVPPDKTILEAGLDADIDLPYSCQSGLCTACRGKCLSGKVKMDEEDGLSEEEVKEGYVLTCVGHPLTSNVVIEID
jgi:ring-1,2-phenylacetyl-CoA epoxidase subunit PaaE